VPRRRDWFSGLTKIDRKPDLTATALQRVCQRPGKILSPAAENNIMREDTVRSVASCGDITGKDMANTPRFLKSFRAGPLVSGNLKHQLV